MSELIVVVFNDEFKADQVRLDLLKMRHDHLIDLEEAVVVVRKKEGKVRLHHAEHFTLPGSVVGGALGTIVGLMLINPLVGIVGTITGAAIGAVSGTLKGLGIDVDFIKEFGSNLTNGTSALFIQVKEGRPEKVIEEINKFQGKILQTELKPHDDASLKAAMEEVRKVVS